MGSERELPEGVPRKQIVTVERVRQYVRDRSSEEDMTVSEFLRETAFPEDWEEVFHGYTDDEIVRMKVTPEVDEMVDRMTGGRVDKGEVVAFYALIDALRTGDEETVKELIEYIPEVLWERMEGRS